MALKENNRYRNFFMEFEMGVKGVKAIPRTASQSKTCFNHFDAKHNLT
jgi:hypothetical protein